MTAAQAQTEAPSARPVTHRSLPNRLRGEYALYTFSADLDPWHLASLEYARRTRLGTALGRVNYGHRFGDDGWQVEVDAYPRLPGSWYGYLNVGYGFSGAFPEWRFGAEVFANLPGAWEASAGLRHLRFAASTATIYTGSVGKYVGNYWVSLRPFVTPRSNGTSYTGLLWIRRYFRDADNYVGLLVGGGSAPTDVITAADLQRASDLKVRVEGEHPAAPRVWWGWFAAFDREEFAPDRFRNRVAGGLRLSYRF